MGIIIAVCSACSSTRDASTDGGAPNGAASPQYLTFQLFIYGPPPDGNVPSPALNKTDLVKSIDEILTAVNHQTGDGVKRQLGFALGPITLDHTDDQLREIIQGGFALAEGKGMAVAFHMDNSMFWMRRSDLWSVPDNVEWTDWNRTAAPNQMIGWLPGATLAPPMCWNSPALKQEVGRITREVIGAEVARGIDHLRSIGKEHLYAGFIAGWETFLQPQTGFCGLTNLGNSATNPPADMGKARASLTYDWLEFFTGELVTGGVPKDQLYTHIAYAPPNLDLGSCAIANPCAPPSAAFNANSLAGFSTYLLSQIGPSLFSDLAARGNPRWASAEGVNMEPTLTWEQYLGRMFSHNAGLINVFAWNDPTPFGQATMSDDAKAAYRKFVSRQPLQ
ncbi:MAG: hypothetical protein L0387_09525 [Acidobacteria bacterium]|nr:hypothetical protein [Acidobacteriota bacterium]